MRWRWAALITMAVGFSGICLWAAGPSVWERAQSDAIAAAEKEGARLKQRRLSFLKCNKRQCPDCEWSPSGCQCAGVFTGPGCSECLNGRIPPECGCPPPRIEPDCECPRFVGGAHCDECLPGFNGPTCAWRTIEPGSTDLPAAIHDIPATSGARATTDHTYSLMVHELTVKQWETVKSTGTLPVALKHAKAAGQLSISQVGPALNLLSRKEGLEECYRRDQDAYEGIAFIGISCTGYRLPTVIEWIRAVAATPNGLSGAFSSYVNPGEWRAVMAGKPNGLGFYDMLGNVCELVHVSRKDSMRSIGGGNLVSLDDLRGEMSLSGQIRGWLNFTSVAIWGGIRLARTVAYTPPPRRDGGVREPDASGEVPAPAERFFE